MQRKSIITLAAAAVLGFAVLVPQAASAQMWSGFRHGNFAATHFAPRPFVSPAAFHSRFVFRDRFAFRNRFAFHSFPFHHRFFGFGRPFAFAAVAGDGCFVIRRVWRPWGWTWRRIWVCG
jgi:hypothetical protein